MASIREYRMARAFAQWNSGGGLLSPEEALPKLDLNGGEYIVGNGREVTVGMDLSAGGDSTAVYTVICKELDRAISRAFAAIFTPIPEGHTFGDVCGIERQRHAAQQPELAGPRLYMSAPQSPLLIVANPDDRRQLWGAR